MSELENSIPTYMPLKINGSHILNVEIHSDATISKQNVNAVINAITSEESFTQDGEVYFNGWEGALIDEASHQNTPVKPLNIVIANPSNHEPDVTIILTNSPSDQGYSGLTTFVTENNMIKSSHITIYNANDLTANQISAITRHEFGHALGLGHSTDGNDLMYPSFTVVTAFISGLDEKSIAYIYSEIPNNSNVDYAGSAQVSGKELSTTQSQVLPSRENEPLSPNANESTGIAASSLVTSSKVQFTPDTSTKFVVSNTNAVPEFPITPVILVTSIALMIFSHRIKSGT